MRKILFVLCAIAIVGCANAHEDKKSDTVYIDKKETEVSEDTTVLDGIGEFIYLDTYNTAHSNLNCSVISLRALQGESFDCGLIRQRLDEFTPRKEQRFCSECFDDDLYNRLIIYYWFGEEAARNYKKQ